MTNQEFVLDLLRWELEQILAQRDGLFQRASVLIGLVGVAGAVLGSTLLSTGEPQQRFGTLGLWGLTLVLVLIGYATFLILRCFLAKGTLLYELLGPSVLDREVLTQASIAQAQVVVIERLMLVVQYTQHDLNDRRAQLYLATAVLGLGLACIGSALWYNSYKALG